MEVAASVITVAELIWKLLHKSLHYIKEVKLISEPIKELLERVKDLHRLTRAVKSTYAQAEASLGKGSKSLRIVGKALATCDGRLESLKPLAVELASLDTQTWRQKLTVKRRLDKVKDDIEETRKKIREDIDYLNTGLNLVRFELDANRRPSETLELQQPLPLHSEIPATTEDEDIPPMTRSFSAADTLFGPDPDLQLRRLSTAPTSAESRPSISSTLSHAPSRLSSRSDSIISATEPLTTNSKSAWIDFHFHVAKCAGDGERIRQIREILHEYAGDTPLASSTDTWDRTPLHVAAQNGDVDLARTLVEFGADINAQDSEPSSVLDMAIAGGRRHFVAFLLDLNVDESKLQPRNAARLKEMKCTINFEKKNASKKSRKGSQASRQLVI
ncbi:hypothetical protein FB567DRAFT_272383 [Paraphoma chrysanthemicola]|uniref:Ankyrin n=1 Tax=Paraphoma chrysanthemicola TaxID=798071 RepID=A0A8K0W225_9PLEO|nr:hypothetical protein FB567DRAFT_272383 [Paraphoma chrysanthemicola]